MPTIKRGANYGIRRHIEQVQVMKLVILCCALLVGCESCTRQTRVCTRWHQEQQWMHTQQLVSVTPIIFMPQSYVYWVDVCDEYTPIPDAGR